MGAVRLGAGNGEVAAAEDRDSGWAGRQGRGVDQRRGYLVLEAHLPGGAVRREAKEAGRDAGRSARGNVRGVAQRSLARSPAQLCSASLPPPPLSLPSPPPSPPGGAPRESRTTGPCEAGFHPGAGA